MSVVTLMLGEDVPSSPMYKVDTVLVVIQNKLTSSSLLHQGGGYLVRRTLILIRKPVYIHNLKFSFIAFVLCVNIRNNTVSKWLTRPEHENVFLLQNVVERY